MANTPDMAPTRRKASGSIAAEVVSSARERELEAQISQLQSDLKDITETLGKLTNSKVDEAKAIAKTEIRHLQEKGQQLIGEAQDHAGEIEKQLKDTIREKPLTAVAAAAGIGFVFALLTRH